MNRTTTTATTHTHSHTVLICGLASTVFTWVISAGKEKKPLLPHFWEVLHYCNFYYFNFLSLLPLLVGEFPLIFQIIFSNQIIQDLPTGLIFSGFSGKEPTEVPKSRHYQAIWIYLVDWIFKGVLPAMNLHSEKLLMSFFSCCRRR